MQDDFLRRECGEELVIEENSSTSELYDEEYTEICMDYSPSPLLSLPALYPYLCPVSKRLWV